jgi:hypothetical protein
MWQPGWKGEMRVGVLAEKLEGRRTRGRPRRGWQDNIKNGYIERASTGLI